VSKTYPNRTEAAIADLIAGRWPEETPQEWAYRVRGLVEMAKRDRPLCSVVLAQRQVCDLEKGHGGRHRWIDR
jgi:hypothetical protein